jgi:hypothetical protein
MAELSTKRILNAREEVLVSLRKEHGGLMKKIKTERTKLEKFKDDVRTITNKSQGAIQAKFQELRKAKEAYKAALDKCSKSKIFTKAERKEFYWLQQDLDEMTSQVFGEGFNMSDAELEEMVRRAAEERHKKGFEFFEHFTPPVPEAEQKSIREVYKRLAARFHPDKAAGKAGLEQRFHAIMQRINTSYQRGDIADLLAIEVEYGETADILAQADSPLVDVVEQEIERVRNEIELCTQQLQRLKTERKNIEKTDDGRLVKDYKKAEKFGLDPIAEMTRDLEQTASAFQAQSELFERLLSGEITKEQFTAELEKFGPMAPEEDDGMMMTEEDLFEFLNMMEQAFHEQQASKGRGAGKKAPPPPKSGKTKSEKTKSGKPKRGWY